MLRLNRLFASKHLIRITNPLIKNSFYYSSEPPESTSSHKSFVQQLNQLNSDNSNTFFRTTNTEINLFGPHDVRAPLNGNIGLSLEDTRRLEFERLMELLKNAPKELKVPAIDGQDFDILISNCSQTRCHKLVLILKYQKYFDKYDMIRVTQTTDEIECSAQELPVSAIHSFVDLFQKPKSNELNERLTAITWTQKTLNDMSGWSELVEQEREEYSEKFITQSIALCNELQANGFWADFIDPFSGQPFFSEHTNTTLFETDERYTHLGFQIEDLGCCKVIYHKKWGTHVCVGTLFTTAPANSPILSKIISNSLHHKTNDCV